VPYGEQYKLRPYPASPRKAGTAEHGHVDAGSRVQSARRTLPHRGHQKASVGSRKLPDLLVTRGAGVEESRKKGLKLVFRAEGIGADKWIAPGVCVVPSAFFGLAGQPVGVCFAHDGFHTDWMYKGNNENDIELKLWMDLCVVVSECIYKAEPESPNWHLGQGRGSCRPRVPWGYHPFQPQSCASLGHDSAVISARHPAVP
jgi:hypothetical protein